MRVELAVQAKVAEEVAVVADEGAGVERGGDGRGAALAAELAGEEEVGGVLREQPAAERGGGLGELVAGDLVAGGGGCGVEVQARFDIGRAVELEHRAVEVLGAAACDDVDHRAGACAVLGRKALREHVFFEHRVFGDVGEDGLAAPGIVAVGAVDHERLLAAASAIGGEEVLVHEDVALVDGGTVGCVEQRQERDAAVEQGGGFDFALAQADAGFGLSERHIGRGAFDRDAALGGVDVEPNHHARGAPATQDHMLEMRGGKSLPCCVKRVVAADGQGFDRKLAAGVGVESAAKAEGRVFKGDGRAGDAGVGGVFDDAVQGGRVGSLGVEDRCAEKDGRNDGAAQQQWSLPRLVWRRLGLALRIHRVPQVRGQAALVLG